MSVRRLCKGLTLTTAGGVEPGCGTTLMQRFIREHCANEVEFDASSCPVCTTQLGYVPVERTLRALGPTGDGVAVTISRTAVTCGFVLIGNSLQSPVIASPSS